MQTLVTATETRHPEYFADRHLGAVEAAELNALKAALGVESLEEFVAETVPAELHNTRPMQLPAALNEAALAQEMRRIADKNRVLKSFIGQGYANTFTPAVIQRNILENPGWYTQYTPYQAEIAQGRLEALVNFQTMVADLTGMDFANASLLDEATAAAEAMTLLYNLTRSANLGETLVVSHQLHPQTLAVLATRAEPLGIQMEIADVFNVRWSNEHFAVLLQYPTTTGLVEDYRNLAETAHSEGRLVGVATDLLALCVLASPGEWGADVVVGNSQRFGVPLGYGGPHAAFLATREAYKRQIPGRLVGISKDAHGNPAYRLALQTREQHIRREKATSNICTAQVLLAIMAGMYAVYHGPEKLKAIAEYVHTLTRQLVEELSRLGLHPENTTFFDTITLEALTSAQRQKLQTETVAHGYNLRYFPDGRIGIALDETATPEDIAALVACFKAAGLGTANGDGSAAVGIPPHLARTSAYLTHPVFNQHHTETELMRYIKQLERKDLSLTHSMIPLGSCTMKLNAAAELMPLSLPGFGQLHPFVPMDQALGYAEMHEKLGQWLAEITGFAGVSFMPNSGAQGEYTGLMVIRKFLQHTGQGHRNVALIPSSAHGTNPASAVMAGMQVVVVGCDEAGNIDRADFDNKLAQHGPNLAALMITYPSTHGVFERGIAEICTAVHQAGGQVYMDGANLNAQVGYTSPGHIGADVCHLNLHKTFCIPHGGGGPGMGPIGVAAHLLPHLPGHPESAQNAAQMGAVSAAPFGSPSISTISYAYIRMMGPDGLKRATALAILNANYLRVRLAEHYPVLYTDAEGRVAHELILDLRAFKRDAGIEVDDIAKRLMDYGFHSPTVSWPVPGTIMIEPTESESVAELDRFCEAMIAIREEIRQIETGIYPREDNPLKNAPHTAAALVQPHWEHPYSRQVAVFPLPYVAANKFWPSVARVDNSYGDRNLFCSCLPIEAYQSELQPA